MSVERIGLVVHRGRPEAVEAASAVHAWCRAHDIPCTEIDVWKGHEPRHGGQEEASAAGHPDLVLTLGGDGTFLRGARIAAKSDAAVLGVDLGRVGFLTEVPAEKVTKALDTVHEGRAEIEERMTLTMRASRVPQMPSVMEALLRSGRVPTLPPPHVRPDTAEGDGWGVALDIVAVNDVVLEKLVRDRQVALGVYIAGRLLAAYSADAVIVASPTGSTAYSFAAGGPVLSPHMDAVVFTPVAAHMTFDRTVVAAPDEPVALRVLPHSGEVALSIDGQLRGVIGPGDWVGVYGAKYRLRLVRMGPTDFYTRLRARFRLTDAPATAADGESAPLFRPNTPVPDDLAHLRLPPPPRTDDSW
ncbi:NAD(+)/NADH kinase [Streptomyces scopuliridis]|uniref:NAD(+)/NADH kinase n=1 Tax=Streptomyces scopuliridis TaxID=452529 RepID=A0ACD4ZDE2_9ACTN|nr:NAD(+)/NADH kinase [Streptomyces scopuliridis]WSB32091.1 NAD(+)/NADH kinase [Streptomyces scopuliridis]WSB96353.1 NAD(+)/NADH kinase [Streptomyces scopuliridis]WSC09942.1 NAD(+)/NADH kinase [Streptomyces scopuliridis]